MNLQMYQKVLEKVPDLVMEILGYEGGKDPEYEEVVRSYTAKGTMYSVDRFMISELTLLNHIMQAKKHPECTIDVRDDVVTVRRTMKDGCYFVAEYRPTPEAGVEVKRVNSRMRKEKA